MVLLKSLISNFDFVRELKMPKRSKYQFLEAMSDEHSGYILKAKKKSLGDAQNLDESPTNKMGPKSDGEDILTNPSPKAQPSLDNIINKNED